MRLVGGASQRKIPKAGGQRWKDPRAVILVHVCGTAARQSAEVLRAACYVRSTEYRHWSIAYGKGAREAATTTGLYEGKLVPTPTPAEGGSEGPELDTVAVNRREASRASVPGLL